MENNLIFSIEGFNKREPRSFAAVSRHFYKKLTFISKEITRDDLATEEIISKLFEKLWNRNEVPFENLQKLGAYLKVSVRNMSFNYMDRQQTRKKGFKQLLPAVTHTENGALEQMIRAEMIEKIHIILEKLPPRCREAMKLLHIEGLSNQEVADKMGISIHTVRNHDQQARELLGPEFHKIRFKEYYLLVIMYMLSAN